MAQRKIGLYDVLFFLSLVAISLLIYFIRVNFLDIPLERDEGDYGLAGKMILEGAKPYLDVYEQKPPGLFYSYAFVESMFGTSSRALHLGFMFFNIITVGLIAFSLRWLLSAITGLAGAMCYAILSINPFASGFAVQAEHLLVLFATLSFFFLCHYFKFKKFYALILAGVFVAWSATIKQNGIFFIGIMTIGVFAIHLMQGPLNWKKLVREYAFYAVGGIGVALLVCGAMLLMGVWKEFIFWSITFPRELYVTEISLEKGLSLFQSMYARISNFSFELWYGALAGSILIIFTRLKWPVKLWVVSIVILSFFSIWPGLRFYGHYWIQFFFGLAIGFGGLAYFIEDVIARFNKSLLSFLVPMCLIAIIGSYAINKDNEYYFSPSGEQLMNQIYGDNPFSESRAIANFIKGRNPDLENDQLLVVGSEPQILLETGLKSPTPHTFIIFVASEHPASAAMRAEYLEMMRQNEAKYAVFVVHPYSWLVNSDEAKDFFMETYRHLLTYYKVIGVADMVSTEQTIYKWNQEAGAYKPKSDQYVLVLERKDS